MSYIGAQPTTAAFVTDTFSANGSGTVFTLSVAPANTNSILVAASGVLQDPSTYSVSGTTLTFSAAPPAGTGNISVRFLGIPASGVTSTAYRTQTEFTATAGQTTFSVPSYTVGYIDVYRNGALLGSADFTATNGTTVVLTNPASAGDLIETVSFYVSSVLNAIPAVANAVTTSYINDASVTSAKFANLTTLPTSGGNITLPSVTGTAMVSGNMPAFSAYAASTTSLANTANTTLIYNTKDFDTATCYNNTGSTVTLNGISVPAYSFAPNVAGYYQVNATHYVGFTGGSSNMALQIFKNGAQHIINNGASGASNTYVQASGLVYCNGTSDYISIVIYWTGAGASTGSGVGYKFQAYLARSA